LSYSRILLWLLTLRRIVCGLHHPQSRRIICRLTINLAVPTVLLKAICTSLGNRSSCPIEAPRQHSTTYTNWPFFLNCPVAHRHHGVTVSDHFVPGFVGKMGCIRCQIAHERIRRVREIDDQWGGTGEVLGVTAKERGTRVELQIDERVGVRYCGSPSLCRLL